MWYIELVLSFCSNVIVVVLILQMDHFTNIFLQILHFVLGKVWNFQDFIIFKGLITWCIIPLELEIFL